MTHTPGYRRGTKERESAVAQKTMATVYRSLGLVVNHTHVSYRNVPRNLGGWWYSINICLFSVTQLTLCFYQKKIQTFTKNRFVPEYTLLVIIFIKI